MAIYEYQGQNYDIATDDPVVAKQKIMTHLGMTTPEPQPAESKLTQFGHGMASLADTGLNAITGGLDYGAYNLARAAGLSPEEATQQTTSPKDIIGRAMNITSSPSYQNETSRQITGGIGQGVNAISQGISQNTGLPQQDVSSMLGSASMLAGPALKATGAGAKAVVQAPYNLAKGYGRGLAYPEGTGANSALAPINPTEYYPPEAVQQFKNGQITLQQLEATKTTPGHLYENNPVSNWAYGMAPENAQGQKLVPTQGRLLEGIGETIGSGARKNPLQSMADLAGLTTGLGPIGTAIKAVPAVASGLLQKATQFDPEFASKLAQARQQPTVTTTPVPQTRPVSPAEVAQQAAASHIQNAQAQATTMLTPATQPQSQPQSVVTKAQEMQQRLDQTKKDLESQGLQINPPKINKNTIPETNAAELRKQVTAIDNEMNALHSENVGMHDPNVVTPESQAYTNKMAELRQKYNEVNKQLQEAMKAEKKAKIISSDRPIVFKPLEGQATFTHHSPDKSIVYGKMNDGTPLEIHTDETTKTTKVFNVTDKKNPVLINEYGPKKTPDNVSQMLTEPSHLSNIPKQFEEGINNSQGRIVAELKDGGEWEHGDHKYKLEHLEHGQKRIQVRDSKGAVVYEKYYD